MDHEIYAYQSAGYSRMDFVKSFLFQALSLTIISVFLSFYVIPDFEKKADEILNYSSIEKKLKLLNEDELSHISDSSYLYFSSRNGNYFSQSIFIEDDANGISIISAERLKLIEKNRIPTQSKQTKGNTSQHKPTQARFTWYHTSFPNG